jgi:hypothetical protein|nr:MAG TPA: hypothetical protein [Caudoviricetes sp.]
MFTIRKTVNTKSGVQIKEVPLSIFSTFIPYDGFKIVPTGRFSKKSDIDDSLNLINKDYDDNLHESE